MQVLVPEQSPLPLQVEKQTLASLHLKGAQLIVLGVWHAPLPSQVDCGVKVPLAATQLDALHTVPSAHRRQAPLPSHIPSFMQVDIASALQLPCIGSGALPSLAG